MNLFGMEISFGRKDTGISIDTLMQRLEAIYQTVSGIQVTPETCMQSPTVCAIVTGISRRFGAMPVHVYQKTTSGDRTKKELQPNHPVARLLSKPNDWQSSVDYWQDAASSLVRYGNYYAFKARGQTGPIRLLIPMHASVTDPKQDENWRVVYRARTPNGEYHEYLPFQVHHVRAPARDFVKGDSWIMDVRETIALEIAAEKFGASFFGNGAMPSLVFEYMEGFKGHKTDEERAKFVKDFQEKYTGKGRFAAALLPNGIKVGVPIPVENDKAQFLETRKLQRSIIAGAAGFPPHLVGDLERGTFSNIEHQSLEVVQTVILPYARMFEAAMERDLLTDEDRRNGIIIRFNLDGSLRASFKDRQEGLKIQREAGVISPNDWREHEGMNPISEEDGGETYWQEGPSGQGMKQPAPKEPAE